MALSLKAGSQSLGPVASILSTLSPGCTRCQSETLTSRSSCTTELQSSFRSNLHLFQRGTRQRAPVKQLHHRTVCAATDDLGAAKSKIAPLVIKNAKIVAEGPEKNTLKVRVDIDGKESQRTFDMVLRDLAKNAPPVPGFRKAKGGKTSIVPPNVIYQLMGPKLVRKFIVEEIIKATLLDYVEKEGIKAKKEMKTDQSSEELDQLFEPGKSFGFDATLELDDDEAKSTEASTVPEVVEATA